MARVKPNINKAFVARTSIGFISLTNSVQASIPILILSSELV